MSHYTINTVVRKIEEKKEAVRSMASGVDDDGKKIYETEYKSLGWFVLFEGKWEWLFVGFEKPNFQVGQKIKIRIEPQ